MLTTPALHPRRDDVLRSPHIPTDASYGDLSPIAARLENSLSFVAPALERFRRLLLLEVGRARKRTQQVFGLARSMSFMYGISRLPDDILAIVFKIAVNEGGVNRATVVVSLAQVSRRFRYVALSIPSLWSLIHGPVMWTGKSFRPLSQICLRLKLERSAQAPLDIGYDFRDESDKAWFFRCSMGAVLPHVNRWKSYSLEFNVSMEQENIGGFVAKLGTVCAPKLETLCLSAASVYSDTYPINIESRPVPFSKWSLPNLQNVELQDFIIDVKRYPTVTRLSETVSSPDFDFKSFNLGLKAVHSMRYLHLGLIGEKISQDFPPHIHLPSVIELSLCLRVRYTKPFDIALTAINCPNVTNLSIKLFYMRYDETHILQRDNFLRGMRKDVLRHYIRHLFAPPERFRKIVNLTLIVMPSPDSIFVEGDLGHALYALPLTSLPSLRNLTLESSLTSLRPGCDGPLFEVEEGQTYPAIETISLRTSKPDRLHDWLGKFMEKLEKQGDWDWCFRHFLLQGKHRTADGVEEDVVESLRFSRNHIHEWISSSAVSSLVDCQS